MKSIKDISIIKSDADLSLYKSLSNFKQFSQRSERICSRVPLYVFRKWKLIDRTNE
jgi:hypothetical protein